MSRLSTFFHEEGTGGLSVFYPTNHIVAVFTTPVEALRVKKELDRVAPAAIAVTGDELLEFAADQVAKDGLWGAMMREVSRIIGTEEQYVDEDLDKARKGASFVAAECPNDELKASAWAILKTANPLAARFYGTGGIEHLVGGTT